MTPSHIIIDEASRTFTTTDAKGRKLMVRQLTALDTLRVFKAAGPALAHNEPWLSMASLVFSLLEIDGIPVPAPVTEAQIETLVERLGDDGLSAIASIVSNFESAGDIRADVGNLPGTPS